jgi:glycosyltransferase involved in cell wall biosynthesis
MAVYTPVVATLAPEGLAVEDGVHLLVGSDATSIANHLISVLGDSALGARIGRAGGELIRANYTWEASVAALEGLYRSVIRGDIDVKPARSMGRAR